MWQQIWIAMKSLAGSKKFQAAVLAAIVWAVGKIGLHLTAEEIVPVAGPLWLYIFGQGLADMGKEKAKIEAAP